MILVISTNKGEVTTDIVCEYLKKKSMPFFRLNMESFFNKTSHISLTNIKEQIIQKTGCEKIVIWFRRGYLLDTQPLFDAENTSHNTHKVITQLVDEINTWQSWIVESLQKTWPIVNIHQNVRVNKLSILSMALEIGFNVPRTFMTEDIDFVEDWLTNESMLISKPLSDVKSFHTDDKIYRQITKKVTIEDLQDLKQEKRKILVSLFQEFIPKKGDVRVFYLNGKCFPVLIATNKSSKNQVDGRNFDMKNPVKMSPITLPKETISKIKVLLDTLSLETCSVDFVLGEDNLLYFLEINPVGQFGWISETCSADLYNEFADYLIKKYNENYTC